MNATRIVDHPHVRDSDICPLCHQRKERALLVCWPCYRGHNMRNGLTTLAAELIDSYERQLS